MNGEDEGPVQEPQTIAGILFQSPIIQHEYITREINEWYSRVRAHNNGRYEKLESRIEKEPKEKVLLDIETYLSEQDKLNEVYTTVRSHLLKALAAYEIIEARSQKDFTNENRHEIARDIENIGSILDKLCVERQKSLECRLKMHAYWDRLQTS